MPPGARSCTGTSTRTDGQGFYEEALRGAAISSDGFFPFRDSIDRLAQAGISSVIQPGGSLRDWEVVEACNEHGIAMVFTGERCFSHH